MLVKSALGVNATHLPRLLLRHRNRLHQHQHQHQPLLQRTALLAIKMVTRLTLTVAVAVSWQQGLEIVCCLDCELLGGRIRIHLANNGSWG